MRAQKIPHRSASENSTANNGNIGNILDARVTRTAKFVAIAGTMLLLTGIAYRISDFKRGGSSARIPAVEPSADSQITLAIWL